VRLERADLELDADSMELDMRQRRLRLEGSVAATLEQRR
jgi:hypothetical protein